MAFEKDIPVWNAAGAEPPDTLKNEGFKPGMKPAADYFNWFWHNVSEALRELQAMTPDSIGAIPTSVKNRAYQVATSEELDTVLNKELIATPNYSVGRFEVSFTAAIEPLGGGSYIATLYKISDQHSMVEMAVYATPYPKIWTRAIYGGVWKDWVYLTNSAEQAALRELVDGKWDRLAVYKADADTTLSPVILTNVGTLPTDEFWYVHTTFFGTVSETSARKQVAYGYTQNKVYTRRYFEGAWSEWTIVYTGNNKPTPAEIGASPDGLVVNKYTVKSESEIDNAITTVYASMADNSSRFITMFVDTSGLSLSGGGWHFILNRTTATYGTLFGMCYGHNSMKMRFIKNGTLQAWQTIYTGRPTASEVGAIPKVAQSPTTGENDLDNVRMVGFYRITDTNINTPVKAVVGHTLMVVPWDNSTVAQVYWTSDVTASGMYFRTRHASGVWTAWQRIYTTGYKPTAEDVGAAKTDLSNVNNTEFASKASAAGVGGTPIVTATRDTSTGSEVYKATVEGLGTDARPIDGYSVTIIPDSTSTAAAARFQLNNQPSYLIRFRGTGKSNEVITPTEPWINMGVALTLTYSSYCGAWLTDIQKITPEGIGAAAASHGNHVPATQTANNATFLRNDNTWQKVTPAGIGLKTENWTFTLEDGSTTTKAVYVG